MATIYKCPKCPRRVEREDVDGGSPPTCSGPFAGGRYDGRHETTVMVPARGPRLQVNSHEVGTLISVKVTQK